MYFFFWPLCFLFFELRILITPFVSSNSSSEHFWRLSFWTYWNSSNSENKKRSNYISPNCSHISLSRLLGVVQVNVLFCRRIYNVHTNLVEIMYTHVYAKISNSYFPSPYKLLRYISIEFLESHSMSVAWVRIMVFNATLTIFQLYSGGKRSAQSQIKPWPVTSLGQALSHIMGHNVSSTPRLNEIWTHNFSGDRHWLHIWL